MVMLATAKIHRLLERGDSLATQCDLLNYLSFLILNTDADLNFCHFKILHEVAVCIHHFVNVKNSCEWNLLFCLLRIETMVFVRCKKLQTS